MLTTSNQNTRQNSMSSSAWFGTVATVCLARDNRWSKHALRQIIRGIQLVDIQEAQQMRTMLSQALGEASVVAITHPALRSDQASRRVSKSRARWKKVNGSRLDFCLFNAKASCKTMVICRANCSARPLLLSFISFKSVSRWLTHFCFSQVLKRFSSYARKQSEARIPLNF